MYGFGFHSNHNNSQAKHEMRKNTHTNPFDPSQPLIQTYQESDPRRPDINTLDYPQLDEPPSFDLDETFNLESQLQPVPSLNVGYKSSSNRTHYKSRFNVMSKIQGPSSQVFKPFRPRRAKVENPTKYYISKVTFGVKSPEEIINQSVCEVYENTIYNKNVPRSNAINDHRMGTVDRRISCGTCKQGVGHCNGHTGYMKLCVPLYNVGFLDVVLKILRSVCYFCSTLMLPDDSYKWMEINKSTTTQERFSMVSKASREETICWKCGGRRPIYKRQSLVIQRTWPEDMEFEDDAEKNLAERPFGPGMARDILRGISDEDCNKMAIDIRHTRPENFITTVLMVPPPSIRPAIMVTEGSKAKGQDDLTRKLQDILKASQTADALIKKHRGNLLEKMVQKAIEELQYHYAVYLNNDLKGIKPDTQRSGAPIRGITQRLKGKSGLVRSNMMGKRVDYSSRTVISADPNLNVDEVGVPIFIALRLTSCKTVTPFNIQEMTQRVLNGADKMDGAECITYTNGKTIDLRTCPDRHLLQLPYGCKVHRYLQKGDYVIFNRHPSLHKQSLMGHKVKPMNTGDTFRVGLPCTGPYNADFDGKHHCCQQGA